MADITNELMYEVLKSLHQRFDKTDSSLTEIRNEIHSMRGTIISVQQDIANIYGVLVRYDQRMDRIETRLELREFAEAQARFEPHP